MSAPAQALRSAGRGASLRPTRANRPTRPTRSIPPSLRASNASTGRGRPLHPANSTETNPSTPPIYPHRSALAASVLSPPPRRERRSRNRAHQFDASDPSSRSHKTERAQHPYQQKRSNSPFPFEFPFEKDLSRSATHDPGSKRATIRDWFASAERAQALEAFALSGNKAFGNDDEETNDQSNNPRIGTTDQTHHNTRPFAWRDFDAVVAQLPQTHWATPFVTEAARSLQHNAGIAPAMKDRVLDELLTTLSDLTVSPSSQSASSDRDHQKFQDA